MCPFYSKDNSWKNNSITDEISTFLWGRTHWLWAWHISFDVCFWNHIVLPSWHGSLTGKGLWLTLPSRPRKSQTSSGIPLSHVWPDQLASPELALFLLALSGLSENLLRPQTQLMEDSMKESSNWCFFCARILHQPNIAFIETIIYAVSEWQPGSRGGIFILWKYLNKMIEV